MPTPTSRHPWFRALVAAAAIAATPIGSSAQVVINEIDYDQPGTDTAEFVELLNVSGAALDLAAFELQLVNGSNGSAYQTYALPSVSLAPGGYFVICGDAANTPNCDLDVSPNSNLIQNGAPDAVALLSGGAVVDAVSYEGTVPGFSEGSGAGLVDNPGEDFLGLSRSPDGADTGQNDVDLAARCITPGQANGTATSACPNPGQARLLVNEVDVDQGATDDSEFVEIVNVGSAPADLSTFTLELVSGVGGSAGVYASLALPAVSLAPGGYFVVCSNPSAVPVCDLDLAAGADFIQDAAPAAVALAQGSAVVDALSYGGDTPGYTEGSGAGLLDPPGTAFAGLSRFPDAGDSDQNAIDFSPRCVSPGRANVAAASGCVDPTPPPLVINEIDYDQPGTDAGEFVEIANTGSDPIDLGAYELVLVNGSNGSVYRSFALPAVSLAGGGYFVVCGDASQVASCDLDVTPDTNLIQNGSPDAVALLLGGAVVDAVSYEGVVPGFGEGAGAPADGSSDDYLGLSRFPDGADSGDNATDLSPRCVTPGLANASASSGCTPPLPPIDDASIPEIQGPGLVSPLVGRVVTTRGNVVTAVGTDGFFVQTPAGLEDGDPETSEGLFVFTGSVPAVSVGDVVDVTGAVAEFFGFTELGSASFAVVGTAAPVPAAVVLDADRPTPLAGGSPTELERFEGMRVAVSGGTVGSGNQGFGSDPVAEVYVVAGPARAFREPGIEAPGLAGLPVWDGNPEIFELDPDRLGLPNLLIGGGSRFDAQGVLGFEFGGYELWPTELTVAPAALPRAVRAREVGEFTIGSLNLFRLFDPVDDPGTEDDGQSLPAAVYASRLSKLSLYIRDVLGAPEVLAVQEAEKLGVLQDLADRIAADDPGLLYDAWLEEGNDIGGIDVGFLVRDTVAVDSVTQLAADETLTVDGSLLHDRPPLLLVASWVAGGAPFSFEVLGVHNRSLSGIDDDSSGPRVRQKRLEQAQSIATIVQARQALDPDVRLVVIGDFNAFEFSDGYVDVVGQIAGSSDPSQSLLSGPDLVDPDLVVTALSLAAEERYSFEFRGNAQLLDHALASRGLAPWIRGLAYGRGNADAPEQLLDDGLTPLRSSDHDGLVLYVMSDSDADGIAEDADSCPATRIPERVPRRFLGLFRLALVDGDGVFDTRRWGHGIQPSEWTLEDTSGCSCEQILKRTRGIQFGQWLFGCREKTLERWSRGGDEPRRRRHRR